MKPSFEELLLKVQSEMDPQHTEKSLKNSAIRNAFAKRAARKDEINRASTPEFNFEDEDVSKVYNLKNPEEYQIAKSLANQSVEKFKKEQEEKLKSLKGVDDIRRILSIKN
jgi:hypothetical protein